MLPYFPEARTAACLPHALLRTLSFGLYYNSRVLGTLGGEAGRCRPVLPDDRLSAWIRLINQSKVTISMGLICNAMSGGIIMKPSRDLSD